MKILAVGRPETVDVIRSQFELPEDAVIDYVREKPRNMQKGYDIVYSNFSLQLVPWLKVEETVSSFANALRPAGELIVIVPSLEWAAYEILNPKTSGRYIPHLFGTQNSADEFAKSGFTLLTIRAILSRNGIAVTHAQAGSYQLGNFEAGAHIVRGEKR